MTRHLVQEIQVPRRGASGKRLKFSSFAAREKRDAVERHLSQCIKAGDPIIIVLYCRYETGYAQVTVKCHLHFDGKGCSVGPKKHFTRVPYEQVFTTLADARTWASWHGELGIPEEPFHSKHVAQELTVEAAKQLQEGDVLASQKTLVLRALVLQDPEDFPHLVRTLSGPAQTMRTLREVNRMTRSLMNDPARSVVVSNPRLDKEAARRQLLWYCSAIWEMLSSPNSCFLTGIRTVVGYTIQRLRKRASESHTLPLSEVTDLKQLNTWTKCVERGIAQATMDAMGVSLTA